MTKDPVTARQDLPIDGAITEGDDYVLTITLEDENGNAIDISNDTFWITVKENVDDADSNATIGPNKVTSHTDPTNGETQLTLDDADTSSLKGKKFYDVQRKKSGGTVQTLMKGGIHFGWGATDEVS